MFLYQQSFSSRHLPGGPPVRHPSTWSALLLLALTPLQMARAEVSEVRLAQQTSMGYMQFSIMDRYKLIEKYAKAAGLGEIKVYWDTFNGPDHMNDALLAGRVDFVSGGVPGLVTLWATQTIINTGMTVGLLPVIGITLPLMSYGGSSLLLTAVGVGLLLNVGARPGYEVAGEPFRFE